MARQTRTLTPGGRRPLVPDSRRRPPLTAEQVHEYLRFKYNPKTLDRHEVVPLLDVVEAGVNAVGPHGSETCVLRHAYPTLLLAHFAVNELGLALDANRIFDPVVIDRFREFLIADGRPLKSVADVVVRAERVARAVSVRAPFEPLPQPMRRGAAAAAYTPSELAKLWSRVDGMTGALGRFGRAVFLLAVGVGADGRTLGLVRGNDITISELGVAVCLGAELRTPRTVWCSRDYEEQVAALAEETGGRWLVGKTSSLDRVFDLTRPGDQLRFEVSRLRATWIHHHVSKGTPLDIVRKAAGWDTYSRLGSFIASEPVRSHDEIARALRGTK